MPLPANAGLDRLIDILVDQLVAEIERADGEPSAQPSHDPEGEAIGRTSRRPVAGQRPSTLDAPPEIHTTR
jgi:hypothetical protein